MINRIFLAAFALAVSFQATAQTKPTIPATGTGGTTTRDDLAGVFSTKADLGRMMDMDSVAARGADVTGVASATTAMRASQATGRTVYLPAGTYHLTDTLNLGMAQCLVGDGRTRSVIRVAGDFNPNANAVIAGASGEPGLCVRDVGVVFDQPADQGSRANYRTLAQGCTSSYGGTGCKYPPAFLGTPSSRSQMDRVRISGAWDGIALIGNGGGISFNGLEVGALNVGLAESGGLDFCHLTNYHSWPFGLTSAAQLGIYADGVTVAGSLGQCDGWDIRGFTSYNGKLNVLADTTQMLIANLSLDGDHANLNVAGGNVKVSGYYGTSATPADNKISVSGGYFQLSDWEILTSSAAPAIMVTGGTVQLGHGRINQNALDQSAIMQTGGRLYIDGVAMSPGAGARTAPYVVSTATITQVRNSTWDQRGNSSGIGLQLGVDSIAHVVQNNDFGGWQFLPFAGGTVGTYGPNKVNVFGFVPSLHPTTPGTWAPNYTVQNGRYWYRGDGIEWEMQLVFSTNAYSGTSGGMVITGFPFGTAPVSNAAGDGNTAAVTSQSNVVLDTSYTNVVVQIASPPTSVSLVESGSGVPLTGMSAASFPPSRPQFQLSIHGFIPTN